MAHADRVHSTILPNSPSLNATFVEAGRQLLNVRAHHIVGGPERHDAEFGWVDQRLFKDQLLNALGGDRRASSSRPLTITYLDRGGLRCASLRQPRLCRRICVSEDGPDGLQGSGKSHTAALPSS
jgi:hypothetical protein